jgi:hypothetical protein
MENDPIVKYVEEVRVEKETVPNTLEHPLVSVLLKSGVIFPSLLLGIVFTLKHI